MVSRSPRSGLAPNLLVSTTLTRLVHFADFAPLAEQLSVVQLDGDAPRPLRSQIRFPILKAVDAGYHPPSLDLVRHQSAEDLIWRRRYFGIRDASVNTSGRNTRKAGVVTQAAKQSSPPHAPPSSEA